MQQPQLQVAGNPMVHPEHSSSISSSQQQQGRAPLQEMQPGNPLTENTGSVNNRGAQYPQSHQPVVNLIHDQQGYAATPTSMSMSPTKESGNHPMESFELEGNVADNNTVNSGGTSWTLRIPWLRRKRHRRIRQDDENSSIQSNQSRSVISQMGGSSSRRDIDPVSVYYGGVMGTTSPSSVYEEANNAVDGLHNQEHYPTGVEQHPGNAQLGEHPPLDSLPQHNPPPSLPLNESIAPTPTASNNKSRRYSMSLLSPFQLVPKNNNKVFRNRSWISTSSNGSSRGGRRKRNRNGRSGSSEEDSLEDFDENEWTPQDSAYGAAIPICGWVPKRLRQFIEATLIAFTVFALVYLVVTTSIQIQENKQNGDHNSYYNGSSYVNANKFDDDYYVEFSQYANDEDDYFTNDDAAAAGDDNGGG